MPFTDPMADGPAIQAARLRGAEGRHDAAQHARAGAASSARPTPTTPIVLMGYYNPIYRLRRRRASCADAVAAGVDGLIIVDLPPEEDAELLRSGADRRLDFIRLATPTTDDARLPAVLRTPAASSTTSRSPASPAPAPRPRSDLRRGRAAAPPHRPAGRGRLRHQDAGSRPPRWRGSPTPRWSARPSSTASRPTSDESGQAAARTGRRRAGLRAGPGRRRARRARLISQT